jgi:hypothetical protein
MLNFCGIVVAIFKMANTRIFSILGMNSGHHYLPTYTILMISDNVQFDRQFCMPCFGNHFENGRHLENVENEELLL